MVNVQMLAELEEVIQFKLVPERREVIREMWWNRLRVFTYYYHQSSVIIFVIALYAYYFYFLFLSACGIKCCRRTSFLSDFMEGTLIRVFIPRSCNL